jgi:hypothetical protein
MDQEAADTQMLAPIYFKGASGEGALTSVNGNLGTYNGVPFIIHDGAGQGPLIAIGTNFNNVAENQPAAEIILFAPGTNNLPYAPDVLQSVTIADTNVPLSNEIGNPHVIATGGKTAMPTKLAGTTAGLVRWSEPGSGGPNKQIVLNFQAYQNITSTAQAIPLGPSGFVSTPSAYGACPKDSFSATATAIRLPSGMNAPFTGECFVAGE